MPTTAVPTTEQGAPTKRERRAQQGAASMLLLSLVAVAVGLIAAIGVVTPALVDQARADAVADVVALAAVGGGDPAARVVAERSGATTAEVTHRGDGRVEVSVVVGGREAVATAAPAAVDPAEEPVGGP